MVAARISKSDPQLAGGIHRHFSSPDEALLAAGVNPAAVRGAIAWDKDKIIAAVARRQEGGLPMNSAGIQRTDGRLASAIISHFGSHDAALQAAGIDPATVRLAITWDKDKVIAALRRRREMGLAVNHKAVHMADIRLSHAATAHFGSYDAALRAAGIEPAEVRLHVTWDKQKIITALQELRANEVP